MALRSLGATLLAKAGTGSALRKLDENKNQGAVPEGNASANPSSVSRSTVNQPLEIATPAGSEKQVAVKPQIQPNLSSAPGSVPMSQGAGLLPQMGGASAAASANRNINTPISAPSAMRVTTAKSSVGGVAKAAGVQPMLSMIAPTGNSGVGSKTPVAQTSSYNPVSVPFQLGGRSSAAEPGAANTNEVGRSLLQGVAATVANAIQGGGGSADKKATNPVSKALINFANTPSAAKSTGIATNVNKAVSNVSNTLRSVASQASNTASSAAKQVSSWLRSLFKW